MHFLSDFQYVSSSTLHNPSHYILVQDIERVERHGGGGVLCRVCRVEILTLHNPSQPYTNKRTNNRGQKRRRMREIWLKSIDSVILGRRIKGLRKNVS